MTDETQYIIKNNSVYIELDDNKVGQEISNLILIVKCFKEKIVDVKNKMHSLDDDSDEYYEFQDEMNDYEMVVSDSEDRYEVLIKRPQNNED